MPPGFRIERPEEKEDEKAIGQGKEENQKGLKEKVFKVDPIFEELGPIEKDESGKGVKTERISGKEVHPVAQKESDEATGEWRIGEPQVEGQDQNKIRPDPVKERKGEECGLKGQK